MNWNYQRTEKNFDSIPAGDHRVVIESAEQAVSKSGNDMLVIKLQVSGYTSRLWHYIVFMDSKPEITNQKLTELFDAFNIEEGNFNLASYVGKMGAAHVKIDDQGYSKVAYFLRPEKAAKLPPWKGEKPTAPQPTPVETPDDLPW